MAKKNKPIVRVTLKQMLDFRTDATHPDKSVTYEDYCIVGHDIVPIHRPDQSLYLINPTRMDAMFVILCLDGKATVRCDLQRYEITPNTLFVCKPGSVIQAEKGHLKRISFFISDERFNEQLNVSFKKLLPHYSSFEKLTSFQLEPSQSERVNTMLGLLSQTISMNPEGIYYHECVRSQVVSFGYEIISCFANKLSVDAAKNVVSTNRQEEYFRMFINLLAENFREQHRVKFYADKIKITPKYLSSTIAELTGRSPSKWVDEYLLTEARMLLQNTDMSIQQISEVLHFPNQSFFGKYFKSHTGLSPSRYRG